MSEEYRFMRYYLPGSLFLIYMIVLTIPSLSAETIKLLSQGAIIGIFTGAFVASPIVGYIIYSFCNHLFEHWAKKKEWRPALGYISNLEFVEKSEFREHYKEQLECFMQKKEFLDLVYHSTLESQGKIKINPKILQTLKNHLSNFAARVVCGLFVPLLCVPSCLVLSVALRLLNVDFSWNEPIVFVFSTLIILISGILLWDYKRVLYEAYQLEAYFIKVKEEEIKELLEELFLRRKEQADPKAQPQ